MRPITTSARRATTLAVVLLTGIAAGCGDDESATHEQFFEAACDQIAGIELDQAFEQFFTDHPEATLADWAGFLPGVVSEMDELVAVTDLPHPSSDDANLAALRTAVLKVQDNFRQAQAAAEAGDQATFDRVSDQNQSVDVAAMESAMQAVDPRECPGSAN